jgi:hypothetical protein
MRSARVCRASYAYPLGTSSMITGTSHAETMTLACVRRDDASTMPDEGAAPPQRVGPGGGALLRPPRPIARGLAGPLADAREHRRPVVPRETGP